LAILLSNETASHTQYINSYEYCSNHSDER
jgi:hypothetical protein